MFATARAEAEFPPIEWGGDVGLIYRLTKNEDGEKTSQLAPTLNLRALSYIYEPWFATWYANILVSNVQTSGSAAGTDSQVIDGRAQIDLFPQSQFPGQAFVEATDTRITADDAALELGDYRLFRYGYNQRYMSLGGESMLYGAYEGTREDRLDTGQTIDTQELEFNGFHQTASHRFEGNGLAQQTTVDPDGADTGFYVANAGHTYTPGADLIVASNVSVAYNEAESDFDSASLTGLGLSNRVDWRATERLRLTSEIILDHREGESDSLGSQTEEFADLSIFGVYDLRDDLALSGELAAFIRQGATDQERMRQSLTLSYNPESILFEPFTYTYGAGTGIRNETGDEDGDSQNYVVNAAHGLSYTKLLGENGWALVLDGTQTGEYENDTIEGDLTTVSHRVSATLSQADLGGNTYGLLSFYDYRTYGRSEIELQQLTATLSHTAQLDRYQSVTGVFSANAGRTTGTEVTDEYAFASVTATYLNQRLLGVRNLDFESELRADYELNRIEVTLGDDDLDFGRPDSSELDNYRVTWRNELDYTIGLLTARLRADVQQTDSGNSWQVFLNITRSF